MLWNGAQGPQVGVQLTCRFSICKGAFLLDASATVGTMQDKHFTVNQVLSDKVLYVQHGG